MVETKKFQPKQQTGTEHAAESKRCVHRYGGTTEQSPVSVGDVATTDLSDILPRAAQGVELSDLDS